MLRENKRERAALPSPGTSSHFWTLCAPPASLARLGNEWAEVGEKERPERRAGVMSSGEVMVLQQYSCLQYAADKGSV